MLDMYPDVLTTEEVAELLRLNPKTIIKLVKTGKIPSMKIANQYRFSKVKITEWIDSEMSGYSDDLLSEIEKGTDNTFTSIRNLLSPEQLVFLSAVNRDEALLELLNKAEKIFSLDNKKELYNLILIRENLHSTGIGRNFALPHPRSVDIKSLRTSFLMMGISKAGLEFKAPDKEPVHVAIMIVIPKLSHHLKVLSHLSRLFHDNSIIPQIKELTSAENILDLMENREKKL